MLADTVRIVAGEAARMLEDRGGYPEFTSLLLAGRDLGRRFQENFERTGIAFKAAAGDELGLLTRDLVKAGSIAGNVAARKQVKMGEALLGI
ncbi:MAG: hypothetical protein KKB20_22450 [Proteobacteria bacterium]|nr:hypothetical protein [Pseudomonadota bacterium]